MSRGVLTEEVKAKSKELLGYEISEIELRLMPYIQYILMNEQRIDHRKISREEYKTIMQYTAAGYLTYHKYRLTANKEFWVAMNEILWISYVQRAV